MTRDPEAELRSEMAKPLCDYDGCGPTVDEFDPWSLFPVYGSYCAGFDQCAIDVLTEIATGEKRRHDLGAEMFREMICVLEWCEYGTSPRYCFPEPWFKEMLPALIEKWISYYRASWGEDYQPGTAMEKEAGG